jgi:hypothetical protein
MGKEKFKTKTLLLIKTMDEPILNHLQDVKVQFSSTQDMVSLFYTSIIVTDCHIRRRFF